SQARRGLTALGAVSTFLALRSRCPGGGIGRRAGFRCQWGNTRGGSSPLLGTTTVAELSLEEHARAIGRQIRSFRKVLAQQPIRVLVRPSQPRARGIAEVHFHVNFETEP